MSRYGRAHRAVRRRLLPQAIGQPCARCGRPITADDEVDLDHRDDGDGYLGLAHSACNRSAGARKGNARRANKENVTMTPQAFGIEISTDRLHTSIVAAGHSDDTTIVFDLIGYLDGSDTADLIAALVADRSPIAVVVDPRSPAATLIEPLGRLGVTITEPTTHDMAVAHGRFVDGLRAGQLRYVPHAALSAAVQHAQTRPLAGAEALERRRVEADAGPLNAAELAVWGLLRPPPKKPGLFVAVS